MSETATVEAAKPIEAPPPMIRKILERDFSMDGNFAFTRASLVLPLGWEIDDCLKPEFWMNVSHWFKSDPATGSIDRAGTIIEVRTEDHAFYAELYVRAVRGNVLDVAVLTKPIQFGVKSEGTPEYKLRWNLGHRGFDIIRASDNVIVESGAKFPTKELALKWIEEVTGVKVAA